MKENMDEISIKMQIAAIKAAEEVAREHKVSVSQQLLDIMTSLIKGHTLMYTKCDICGNCVIKYDNYKTTKTQSGINILFLLHCDVCGATAYCEEQWIEGDKPQQPKDAFVYFEVIFNDEGCSFSFKGKRVPTVEEAKVFCAELMKEYNFSTIIQVREIDYKEAQDFFDTSDIDNWPVFE